MTNNTPTPGAVSNGSDNGLLSPAKARLKAGRAPVSMWDDPDVPEPPVDLFIEELPDYPYTPNDLENLYLAPHAGDTAGTAAYRVRLGNYLDARSAKTSQIIEDAKFDEELCRQRRRNDARDALAREKADADDEYLPVHDLAAVADEGFVLGWLVQGWWPHPAFGQLAGAEKTLKSYISTLLALAVASGADFLGTYPVRTSGSVLVYTGEGSRHLWWRRAEHLGRGMGLSAEQVQALPIRVVDEIAQIKTPVFKRTLDRELERKPVLVILDPLYAYHGSQANAGNLHEVADILTALSGPTQRAGASLVVVNHFTKAGAADLSLSSITWAGAREWSGAWCLLKHAKPPDLARQQFVLDIVVGSREGNGANRRLEIDLGPLDEHTMRHEGAPTWTVGDIATAEVVSVEDQITNYLWAFQDGDHRPTESDVLAFLKGTVKRAEAKSAITVLVIEGGLVKKPGPHREGDSTKTREVFYLGRNGVDLDGS